jgi:hypothetical protein
MTALTKTYNWQITVMGFIGPMTDHPSSDIYFGVNTLLAVICFPAAIAWPWFMIGVIVSTFLAILCFFLSKKWRSNVGNFTMKWLFRILITPCALWVIYAVIFGVWFEAATFV